jgi:peptide/nickel transport system substrate-binding protein
MKKEPTLIYIFRLFIYLAVLVLMGMLYWSSNLLELKMQSLHSDLKEMTKDLEEIQSDNQKVLQLIQEGNIPEPTASTTSAKNETIASSEKNLLSPDLFYEKALPRLLGPHFKPHGQRKEGTIGRPDNLQPFNNWGNVLDWYGLCLVSLSNQKVGIYETYTPNAALAIEVRPNEKGEEIYWIRLRENINWVPLNQKHFGDQITLAPQFLKKHPVTAHDYKFYYDAVMNKGVEETSAVTMRQEYDDIEEFKVIDDLTFSIKWKSKEVQGADGQVLLKPKYRSLLLTGGFRPLPRFVYQYFANGKKIIEDDSQEDSYRTSSLWAQNFSHHWANNYIVSCGAWTFDGMTDNEIKFKRNPDYYNPLAALVSSFSVFIKNATDGIWEDFKAGNLDLFEIPPYQLNDLDEFMKSAPYQLQEKANKGIKKLEYLSRAYTYLGWNEVRPYFKSKKVRQALTMAIDRERIIRQNLNGMGTQTTGTFFPFSPSYDPSIKPYPFDPVRALELLNEEGWFDSQGSGILTKEIDGKLVPFQFTLTYFVKNLNSKAICEYIATALKEIGIECIPNGVEIADLSKIFADRNFDSLYLAWGLGSPPEDPRQLWYTADASQKGSSNAIGFSNKEVDDIIDQLEYEYDPEKRKELFYRFDAIIHDEAPYTFLYVPKTTLVYREYLQNVFIPAKRQDLIPGANEGEPISSIYWINLE